MRTFTIGEVLNRLKDEFDDITISKIRFLESEGLIHPDRTESGYRKFTDDDVERLRYVLRTQRDRYLPLKVIKDELERLDAGLPVESPAPPPPPIEAAPTAITSVEEDRRGTRTAAPSTTVSAARAENDVGEEVELRTDEATDVQLSLSELCDITGLDASQVHDLREHGLLRGDGVFDRDDLQIGRAAGALMRLGLEARHLRMYRQFADREIGLYEQLVSPLLRQRNPDSRAQAARQLEDLARLGGRIHRVTLKRELRSLLHP